MRLRRCPQHRRSDRRPVRDRGTSSARLCAIRPFTERQVHCRADPGSGPAVTAPAVYAEGLRVLWSLASRGVSATWDRSGVVLTPPDPTADGVIEKLEAVLRPGADGHSHLQRARERYALFLREVKAAKPADVVEREWRRAFEGLESFLFSGWADEALRLGWPHDELFRVPELWSQIHLCGAALLIGDREVVGITPNEIRTQSLVGRVAGLLPQARGRLRRRLPCAHQAARPRRQQGRVSAARARSHGQPLPQSSS